MQERLDALWNEESGQYRPGPGGVDALVNSLLLLTHSVAAQQGHNGPARNDHRARLIARALVSAPVFIERRPSHPRPAPRRTRRAGRARCTARTPASTSCSTPRSSTASCTPGRRAARSGCPTRRRAKIADRIHRVASSRFWRWPSIRLNQVNWYALMYAADATVTGRPALLRRDLRAQLARFVTGRNFGAGLRFQYLPHLGGLRPLQPRLRRVREHRALVPALLQPGAARRHGAALARGPRARPALGAARDRRLLDARGLPQLGHRARLRALAPGEEARPRAAGADRDRADAAAAAGPRVGALGEVDARPRAALLRAAAGAGGAGCPTPCCSSSSRSRRPSAARGSPRRGCSPTPPARSRPVSAGCAATAAGAVRLRPRHRPSRRHHARLQHGDRRGQPARVPVRRHRARAPVRRRAGRRRQHRRARACRVRAARARAERSPRVRLADRSRAHRPGGHAAAAHARAVRDRGERAATAPGPRSSPGRSRTCARRHADRRALPRRDVAPLHAERRSRRAGGSTRATGARG